jgi:hypothetical protein
MTSKTRNWNQTEFQDVAYRSAAYEHDSSLQRAIWKEEQQTPNNFDWCTHNKQLGMIIGEKIKTAKLRLVYIPQIHLTAELWIQHLISKDFLYKLCQNQEYKRAVKDIVHWWEELKIPKTVKVHHKYTFLILIRRSFGVGDIPLGSVHWTLNSSVYDSMEAFSGRTT